MLDCGAYTGDSAKLFARALHPKEILAAEPDPKTYQKLCRFAQEETACSVLPIHAAISDRDGETEFLSAGSRASGTGENMGGRAKRRMKSQTIPCRTIDTLTAGNDTVDLIKLDVEGAEEEALDRCIRYAAHPTSDPCRVPVPPHRGFVCTPPYAA